MISTQDIQSPEEIVRETGGRIRVAIEGVRPEVDCGRFPIKRVAGESVAVEASIFADGHDEVFCQLLYRWEREGEWTPVPLTALGNGRWSGQFQVSSLGMYRYTLEGWVDEIGTWRNNLLKRLSAGQDITLDLRIGADRIAEAAGRASGEDAARLSEWSRVLRWDRDPERRKEAALREDLLDMARAYPNPESITRYEKELTVWVDRERARFSTWYELFPRSCSPEPGRHGTFQDCEAWLPRIASMGFDVLYLPPIHPIGRAFRKGRNNAESAEPADVGSPWAIGAEEGGHKAVHPQLGTLDDFRRLIAKAREFDLEVALDLAFQCSADHPYVREHPEWFRRRPDGSIQYAENPPKKYQDIYPFDFETDHWRDLWNELESVARFWIGQGVRIFRVDNPHTKPLAFWERFLWSIRRQHPEVLFLAEAFTRPHLMYRLAKLGFSQSYTYFTWRNTKEELTDYFEELTQTGVAEYFRPNLWPNTPDILTTFLQTGGRPAFMIRLLLAATLGASYGIYGPAFELCENTAREPGSEEYLYSEKYELKHRDLNAPANLRELMGRVNHIRRENPALHTDRTLHFHGTDNSALICYSKSDEDLSNVIVTVVNLDAFHRQSGFVSLDLNVLGLDPAAAFEAQDLFGGATYTWQGARNYVELTPGSLPAHVLRIRNPHGDFNGVSRTREPRVGIKLRGDFEKTGPAGAGQLALTTETGWTNLFEGPARHRLEGVFLPEYLPKQRWFAGKSRAIRSIRIADWTPLNGHDSSLALVETRYETGAPDVYLVPLAMAFDKSADQIRESAPGAVLSPIVTPDGSGVLYDATFDDTACAALLALIRDGRQAEFRHGWMRGLPTSALETRLKERAAALRVHRSSAEQSNTSIIYEDRFILKLFRRVQAGPNPDCEIGRFLTEKVHFAPTPPFAGSIEYQSNDVNSAALAMLQSFIANEGDAWTWTLEQVGHFYETCATFPSGEAKDLVDVSGQPPSLQARDCMGAYLDSAALLGQRTAELHCALARDAEDPAFSP